jgi:hypothetical protein
MQQEVKIKALEGIVKLQGERLTRMQSQFDSVLAQMVKVMINADPNETATEQKANPEEFRTPSQEEKEKLIKTASLVLGGTVIEQSETNLQVDGLGAQKTIGLDMEPSFLANPMLDKEEDDKKF